MTTQVIFKIDKKLKDQAMKKAQNEGLPFGMVLKLATKAFVDGTLEVGLMPTGSFNRATEKSVSRALKDIKSKKNLSSHFTNTKEAIDYLKS